MTEEKRKALAEALEEIKNKETETIGTHKGSAEELERQLKEFTE